MMDDSEFLIDVRDVLQRKKDKCYGSMGEAFEDLFFDTYRLNLVEMSVEIVEF
jgi:hypothetical protein